VPAHRSAYCRARRTFVRPPHQRITEEIDMAKGMDQKKAEKKKPAKTMKEKKAEKRDKKANKAFAPT
jgi:hypothetical protein